MATFVDTPAFSATEATKLPEAGNKVPKVTVSPAKGAWSQIVRGAQSGADCDANGTLSAVSSPPSSASDAKKAPVPCSSVEPLKLPSANPASNEQSGSSQIASQEGPTEGSAKPAKQAWKRPNGNSVKTAPVGPVMGAVSWPALGDTTGQKAAEGQSDQLPASAPVIADHTSNATSNRQKGSGKKSVVPPVSPSGSDVNTAVSEPSPKHNGESGKPTNAGGGGGTDRGRVLHQQGAYGHPGHRRNTREQGRPNNGWHAQRNFNYGRDNFPGIQTRFGPRHFPPPATTYANMNPGFINAAGPPTGMYYIPVPSGGPVHGAGYFAAPGMLVPVPDHASLKQMLAKQIEYYFSIENLCRDIFLRSNMDHQGFIPVTVIAAFNRVRSMTTDTNMILDALRNSTVVEVQGDRLRKRNDWMNWLLPTDSGSAPVQQSDTKLSPEGSRTEKQDGSFNSELLFIEEHGSDNQVPEDSSKESVGIRLRNGHTHETAKSRSQAKAGGLTTAFGSIARGISAINEEPTFEMDEELEPEHSRRDVQSHDDGDEDDSDVKDRDVQRLIIVTQRGSSRGDCKVSEKGHWLKGIPDDLANVINDGLYYYEQELHHGTQSSIGWERKQSKADESGVDVSTVSSSYVESNGAEANGPLRPPKSHNRAGFGIRPGHQQRLFHSSPKDVNHRARHGKHFTAESPPSDSIGFFFGATPPEGLSSGVTSMGAVAKLSSSPSTASPGSTSFLGSPPVGSIPKSFPRFQHPSHALLEDNGFKQQKYVKFYNRCLAERKRAGVGCSEEMNSLFRFWCYFLRTNFNRAMYKDFRRLAEEESQAGFNYGMECLFRFYSYGLEQKFKQDLYEDFEHLTLETYKKGNLYGLEKYWAFHHYRKGKNNQPLKKHPELERLLNEEFRSLDDFQKVKERHHKDGLINGNGSLDSADLHLATSRPPSMTPASTTSASIAVS